MRVLILDNNIDQDCWGADDLKQQVISFSGVTTTVRRPPHNDTPRSLAGFDKIIISGSKTSCLEQGGWIDSLDEFLKQAINQKKPVLGVCYGHQAICRVLGGVSNLQKSIVPELGWSEVEVTAPSPLWTNLNKRFYSFSRHYEEVKQLPKNLIQIARSKDCEIQAFQHESQPLFGIQFHPERPLDEAEKTLKKLKSTTPLLNATKGKELYNPEIGKTLFSNFLKL
jgi:GMP synthase-like glutamine amidotransferase